MLDGWRYLHQMVFERFGFECPILHDTWMISLDTVYGFLPI